MVEVLPSRTYAREMLKLPEQIRKEVVEKIDLFCQNPAHPSLRVKKMQPPAAQVWEMSVTRKYRITFQWVETKEKGKQIAYLRHVGTHDILDKNP